MVRRLLAAVCAVGLGLGGATAADEAITIKMKKPGKGEVVKESKTDSTTVTVTAVANGMDIKQEFKDTSTFAYTEEVLDRPDGAKRATKLKRTYEKAEGQDKGQAADYQLAGKTVVIEKGKDKYTFGIDGKPLTGQAADKLDKEFNKKKSDTEMEDVVLPKKPVKVGDSWDIDAKQLVEAFAEDGMELDTKKVKGTGKLVKVYDKGGCKNGVMEITIELPLLKMATGPGDAKALTAGSFMKLEMTADGCIDGTVSGGTMTGKMTGLM